MDNSLVEFAVKNCIDTLKNTTDLEEKLHILIVITDIKQCKKLSSNVTKKLGEAFDYECAKSSDLLQIYNEDSSSLENGAPHNSDLLSKLVNIYIKKKSKEAIVAICSVSNLCLPTFLLHDAASLEILLIFLTKMLAEKQEIQSFEVCDYLCHIISSLPSELLFKCAAEPWQSYLHKGLSNMILSKLSSKFLNKALRLFSVVLDSFGVDWLLKQHTGKKVFIAAVNLAVIEIRLCLENKPFDDVISNYVDMRTSFSIVEIASHYLICGPEGLSDKNVLQLNVALKEITSVIICFIKANLQVNFLSDIESDLFIIHAIRCFGALIAEESRCTSEDIIDILPFLMSNIVQSFDCVDNEELPDYLMAGFCSLTFNDSPRKKLLNLNIENLLFSYIKHKWNSSLHRETIDKFILAQKMDKILIACNILLNIIAFEPHRVRSIEIYKSLQSFIFTKTIEFSKEAEFVNLTGIFCTLGTAILVQTCNMFEENDAIIFSFMQCVILYAWDAFEVSDNNLTISSTYLPIWDTIIDSWLLTMRNLSGIIKNSNWIAQYCIDSEWPKTILRYLTQVNVDSIEIDVKNAFEEVFIALHNSPTFCQSDLQLEELTAVAKKQHMIKLLEIIR